MGWWENIFNTSKPALSAYDNVPFKEIRFFCIDTETTSIEIQEAKLLSIGGVFIEGLTIEVNSSFEYHIQNTDYEGKNKAAIEVHGITQNRSQSGISIKEVMDQLKPRLENVVLVAHHAAFDVSMINKYIDHPIEVPVLDTAHLAMRLELSPVESSSYDRRNYTLDALLDRYHIKPLERHTALGDAYSTALLFIKLIKALEKRGIKKLQELIK
jgi:DNA polymerase-3 subunit epsilon